MYLLTQLWLYLLLAMILGFLVSWVMHRTSSSRGLAAKMAEHADELAQTGLQFDELETRANQYKADCRSSTALLETRETERDHARQLLAASRDELKQSQLSLTDALTRIEEKTGEIRNCRQELMGLESAQKTAQAELGAVKAEQEAARSEVAGMQTRLNQKTSKVKDAAGEVTRLRRDLDSRKTDHLKLTREMDAVREESRQFEADQKSATILLALRDNELKNAVKSEAVHDRHLQEALTLAESRSRELQEVLSAAHVDKKGSTESSEEFRRLQASFDSLRREHEPCGVRLASVRSQLETSRERQLRIRKELAELRTAHEKCAPTLTDVHDELSRARHEVETRVQERNEALTNATKFADDWTETFTLLETRNKEIESIQAEREEVASRAEEFEGELHACRAKAQTARTGWENVVAGLEREMTALKSRTLPSSEDFSPDPTTRISRTELESAVLAAGKGRPPERIFAKHDDLKQIDGVGAQNEAWLQSQGIYYFWQIAGWGPEEAAWAAEELPTFGGRVYRENWMSQAMRLARGEQIDPKESHLGGDHIQSKDDPDPEQARG